MIYISYLLAFTLGWFAKWLHVMSFCKYRIQNDVRTCGQVVVPAIARDTPLNDNLYAPCIACNGSGVITKPYANMRVPPHRQSCPACNGKGVITGFVTSKDAADDGQKS
jgi:hypothetical protein